MGGMTARGFPYPTGTDRVADGDNAIQALAASIDAYWGPYDPVWGACFVPGGGAGVGQTFWHNNCVSAGAAGGVVVGLNGITVPRRAYYLITATAVMTFTQQVAATATLIVGDGATVWSQSSCEEQPTLNPAIGKPTACQTVVILNGGTVVRWGVQASGTSAGIANQNAVNNSLAVRLLSNA